MQYIFVHKWDSGGAVSPFGITVKETLSHELTGLCFSSFPSFIHLESVWKLFKTTNNLTFVLYLLCLSCNMEKNTFQKKECGQLTLLILFVLFVLISHSCILSAVSNNCSTDKNPAESSRQLIQLMDTPCL